MHFIDWGVILIVVILVIAAIRYSRKNRCSGNCANCQTSCSRREPGSVAPFVERYRKDHPKEVSKQ
ncbi:FeoB-associated Cys-rich membrane protein [Allobaculum sp. JKK-2023]|uniref:FeoB-associated Cys-rich membrane protein n=1 Tax=Allobaculum sp. JKK-2023 TaxID=3108943 RepID=UPI002B05DA0F|nr:FeoB-associated Cys-rich membrane protein [Allobaculum sp. JKK-2023]